MQYTTFKKFRHSTRGTVRVGGGLSAPEETIKTALLNIIYRYR